MLSGWGVTEKQFIQFINKVSSLPTCQVLSDLTDKDWASIKTYCNREIEKTIRERKDIQEMIFLGKGLFKDPYYAPFIFAHGLMKTNQMPLDFSITTGSGRHKGSYTIIVKPNTLFTKVVNIQNVENSYDYSMAAEKNTK